jgi:hypothetical protein
VLTYSAHTADVLHVVDVAWAAAGAVATTVATAAGNRNILRKFAFSVKIDAGWFHRLTGGSASGTQRLYAVDSAISVLSKHSENL